MAWKWVAIIKPKKLYYMQMKKTISEMERPQKYRFCPKNFTSRPNSITLNKYEKQCFCQILVLGASC